MAVNKWVIVSERQAQNRKAREDRKKRIAVADRALLASLTAAMVATDPAVAIVPLQRRDGDELEEIEIRMVSFGRRILLFVDHGRHDDMPLKSERDLGAYDMVGVTGVSTNNALGFYLRGCNSNELEPLIRLKRKPARRDDGSVLTRQIGFDQMKTINLARRVAAMQ